MMKLQAIIDRLTEDNLTAIVSNASADRDPIVSAIGHHSDTVVPGALFFALAGTHTNGHDYIQPALENGAAAIVVEHLPEQRIPSDVPLLQVTNCRRAMAVAAACFYGDPSKQLCVIGVTGTNGKTTTVGLIENILTHAGLRCGVIGTIDYHYNGRHYDNPLTTPESVDIQRILADMSADGITHVVMEISSHAIDQQRVIGCHIDMAVFTNLTQDHLDYHHSMARYWSVKKQLFTHLLASSAKARQAAAIINSSHARGQTLVAQLIQNGFPPVVWSVAMSPDQPNQNSRKSGWVHVKTQQLTLAGIIAVVDTSYGQLRIDSPLIGHHNLENIICAAAVGLHLGISPNTVSAGINAAQCIAGRLETVVQEGDCRVCIDYAHTPDALENVLRTLRRLATGRIICVFGCGGDRDRTKRAPMGRIAARWSDRIIVTSDNPRNEPPQRIIADIAEGVDAGGLRRMASDRMLHHKETTDKCYVLEVDRHAAIALGIQLAGSRDTVLIAGKGHETYQLIGRRKRPFDDRRIARQCWQEMRLST